MSEGVDMEKRRKTDRVMYFSGFRDVSRVAMIFLLGIIAYFVKGYDERFKRMENTVNTLSITVAKTGVQVSNNGKAIEKLGE